MNLQFLDPPCSIDQVILLNFSIDNLHKFLNYLLLSDKEAFNKLSELTLKINDIDEMKFSIKQNMEKMVEIHEKVTKVEKVISNFSNKFYEIENIFDNIFKV